MYTQQDYLRELQTSVVVGFDEFGINLNPFKAVASAVKAVAKVVTAPAAAVINTAAGIAKGQNVLQTVAAQAKQLASNAVAELKIAGNVASFIPGLGSAVQFAVQYSTSVGEAIASGRNVVSAAETAAIDAALNSLPGGELTGALIRTVADVAVAGAQGKNILNSAVNELTANAIGLIPNKQAQQVLAAAADAALKGQNVLAGAQAGAVNAALSQIPDPNARAVVQAALQRKSPSDVVSAASSALLSRAASAIPTGGIATLVTGITRKSPAQILVAAKVAGADKLISAINAASAANLANVATRVLTGPSGITGPVKQVSSVVTAAQQIAALAKTNSALAKSKIDALTAAADRGDQTAIATLATLKTLAGAEAARSLLASTVAAATAGNIAAAQVVEIIKARFQQRDASAKFMYTLTPDGRIHAEVA